MRQLILVAGLLLISASSAFAWDGYDYDRGCNVEINEGNLVRAGNSIEVYDYCDSEYHNVTVNAIYDGGGTVTVEVTDDETGEDRTFEMDNNH